MNEREPWRNSSCDNSCMFGSPGGMGTNGGCTCLASERDVQKRIRIHRGVLALKDGIRERDEEIAALREDRDRWYSAAGQRQDELDVYESRIKQLESKLQSAMADLNVARLQLSNAMHDCRIACLAYEEGDDVPEPIMRHYLYENGVIYGEKNAQTEIAALREAVRYAYANYMDLEPGEAEEWLERPEVRRALEEKP